MEQALHSAKLKWATPEGDELVAHIARVSNPANEDNEETAQRLLRYLIKHQHWSPFEMVNACVEIKTTRDVSRQVLRHRSFTFQEFSGRYAAYDALLPDRNLRLQHPTNRQSSLQIDVGNPEHVNLRDWWERELWEVNRVAWSAYQNALGQGIAKEVARALLPEGLVPTRMYMNGSLRSWIHYCQLRMESGTQLEHRILAESCYDAVMGAFPKIKHAIEGTVTP